MDDSDRLSLTTQVERKVMTYVSALSLFYYEMLICLFLNSCAVWEADTSSNTAFSHKDAPNGPWGGTERSNPTLSEVLSPSSASQVANFHYCETSKLPNRLRSKE